MSVDFKNFGENFSTLPGSTIVITDNGTGMSEDIIKTAWMNPATPSKAVRKRQRPKTALGRVLQGEKGIGRFATFKIGSEVTLVSRVEGSPEETTLLVDISGLDEDGSDDPRSLSPDFYLENIPALLDTRSPTVFTTGADGVNAHGTQLAIASLRAAWNERLVRGAFEDISRLQPFMWGAQAEDWLDSGFDVTFLKDGKELPFMDERGEQFEATLERAVLFVSKGRFDDETRTFGFNLLGRDVMMSVDEPYIRQLRPFKERFLKDGRGQDLAPDTLPEFECGSFEFEFYVFDLQAGANTKYHLDADQKRLIKGHRIYLYRDGIRVYPYGDADDDWLENDKDRGNLRASVSVSNDQTVGYVAITQEANHRLRDKTSREGLLESDGAVDDFKALIKTVLWHLREQYQPYLDSKDRARRRDLREHRIDTRIQAIRRVDDLPEKAMQQLDALEAAVNAERELAEMQLARTEQLAGVGLSVETASHDLILAGGEALITARQIVEDLKLLDLRDHTVFTLATRLVTSLDFVNSRFKDVQGLFVSTRQKQAAQDAIQLLRRVRSIYTRLHDKKQIGFEIDNAASLVVVSTEAALLQLLINLVDNATYWLAASPLAPRTIRAFTLDAKTLVVTDSGPGVREQDEPYIFEPFYSAKGEGGKGLGLYIARQNGYRNGFSIDLAKTGDPRELSGATFVVRFGPQEASDDDA